MGNFRPARTGEFQTGVDNPLMIGVQKSKLRTELILAAA
jgi:hypothetical protein